MGQQVSAPQPHKKVKFSSSPPSIPNDITNHIATYLSKKDIASMHSTSTSQSKEIGHSIAYVEAKCATETVDGLTCNTESTPESCVNWCKRNNGIRKFYAVFKMFSQEGAIFKFDNQIGDSSYGGAGVYKSDLISLRLLDGSIHAIPRYNEEFEFSETDASFSFQKYSHTDERGHAKYTAHFHPPEVMRSKFELLASKPFSDWGWWELIIKAVLYAPHNRLNVNEIMSGKINFKDKSIPCKGEVTKIYSPGTYRSNIYIERP